MSEPKLDPVGRPAPDYVIVPFLGHAHIIRAVSDRFRELMEQAPFGALSGQSNDYPFAAGREYCRRTAEGVLRGKWERLP